MVSYAMREVKVGGSRAKVGQGKSTRPCLKNN
jgi:hypothetical protein